MNEEYETKFFCNSAEVSASSTQKCKPVLLSIMGNSTTEVPSVPCNSNSKY